eukprot:g68290.t1
MQALLYLQNKRFNDVNIYKCYDSVSWLCPLSSACKLFELKSNQLSFTIDIVDNNTDNLPNGISKGDVEQFISAFISVALLGAFKSNRNVTSGRNSLWSLEDAKGSPAPDISRLRQKELSEGVWLPEIQDETGLPQDSILLLVLRNNSEQIKTTHARL